LGYHATSLFIVVVLKSKGVEYKLFIFSEEKNIIESIKKFKPDLLCFSTCTGTHHLSFRLAKYIRKHLSTPTLFGGTHVTLFPDECIKEDCVDIVCRGEGEEALIELIDCLRNKKDYSKIKNLWVKKKGKVVKNAVRPLVQDLDSLPLPDRTEYLKYPLLRDFPLKRFITGYGCPFQCSFCHNAMFMKEFKGKGSYLRKKSVDRCFEEIKEVQKISKVKRVHFHDDNFNFHKSWFEEFCERYPKEIGIPWSCSVRVDMLDKDIVKMMHDAGCVGVNYGLETKNERVRNDVLNKRIKTQAYLKAAKLLNKYNIKHIAAIMTNLPGEDFEDAFETLRFCRRLKVHHVRPGVYRIFSKQPIIKWLIEEGYIDKAPELDNYNPPDLEDITLHSKDMQRLIRITPFMNWMLKFPFTQPIFRFLVNFPIDRVIRSRLFEGYCEMRFMDVPVIKGFLYYRRVRKGLKAYEKTT